MVPTRTHLRRNIKKPDFFKPTEDVLEDDYCDDDHDTDFDLISYRGRGGLSQMKMKKMPMKTGISKISW